MKLWRIKLRTLPADESNALHEWVLVAADTITEAIEKTFANVPDNGDGIEILSAKGGKHDVITGKQTARDVSNTQAVRDYLALQPGRSRDIQWKLGLKSVQIGCILNRLKKSGKADMKKTDGVNVWHATPATEVN